MLLGVFFFFGEVTQVQSLIVVNSGYFQITHYALVLPTVFLETAVFSRNLFSLVHKEFLFLDYDLWYQTEVSLLLDVKCPFI